MSLNPMDDSRTRASHHQSMDIFYRYVHVLDTWQKKKMSFVHASTCSGRSSISLGGGASESSCAGQRMELFRVRHLFLNFFVPGISNRWSLLL